MALKEGKRRKRTHPEAVTESSDPTCELLTSGKMIADHTDEIPCKMAKLVNDSDDEKRISNIESLSTSQNGDKDNEMLMEDNNEVVEDLNEESIVLQSEKSTTTKRKVNEITNFPKEFNMLNFRNKLRGATFINELRHFLHVVERRPTLIGKYLEKRGKPLEIVEALQRVDKTNVMHISYLCDALQLVILEILRHHHNHLESAVYASRYFLKSYGDILELLLKSVEFQHRKIALKLLTAIVCVDPQLGRQILSSYDILSNIKSINQFLSHSYSEVKEYIQNKNTVAKSATSSTTKAVGAGLPANSTLSTSKTETTRQCFIHFILAYLVDGNLLLIRNILDRRTLIHALVFGMLYDDAKTVCMILTTLMKYVLECTDISKTKKIHVFDVECCKSLVRLYDWCGPKAFIAMHSDKQLKKSKHLSSEDVQAVVDLNEREMVAKTVHKFLMLLLTSRKYGIVFDSVKYFRQKYNTLQGQLMPIIKNPWLCELKTELIIKILETCPDLYRNTIRNFAGVVNPIRSGKKYFVVMAAFLSKVIAACHPDFLKGALDKITLTDFSYWVKDVCLPLESLMHINGFKYLQHEEFEFRLVTNRLLLSMFSQYKNYMAIIRQRDDVKKSSNSLRKFKFDILNHLLVHFPTMEIILTSLSKTMSIQKDEQILVLQHLDVALDLILMICKENRSFINKTNVIVDFLELLRPLYACDDNDDTERDDKTSSSSSGNKQLIHSKNIQLEMKAIKTILLIYPKAFEVGTKRFSNILKSLVRAYIYGTVEISCEAVYLLKIIFRNTGMFESAQMEVDLWLLAMKFVNADTVDVVLQVFEAVLQVTEAEVDLPKSIESTTTNANLQQLFDNIEKGLVVQAYVEILSISKLMPLIYKGVEIEAPLSDYLECVCLLMFHYFPTPQLILNLYQMKFTKLTNYMNSWLTPTSTLEKPTKDFIQILLPEMFIKQLPLFQQIQNFLFQTESNFEEIFAINTNELSSKTQEEQEQQQQEQHCKIEFKGNLKEFCYHVQNPQLLTIYIQYILFQVQQLLKAEQLSKLQAEKAAEFIIGCLELIKGFELLMAKVLDGQMLNSIDGEETTKDNDENSCLQQLLKYIYNIRLNYMKNTELFHFGETNRNYLLFLRLLTDYCRQLPNFHDRIMNFKQQLVKAVAISFKNLNEIKANGEDLREFLELIKVIELDAQQSIEILDLLASNLHYKDYFCFEKSNWAEDDIGKPRLVPSIYCDLLVLGMERLATLQTAVKSEVFYKHINKIYTKFFNKLGWDLNVDSFEQALVDFLTINHQHIRQIDANFFQCFLEPQRKLNKSSIKLAKLLYERNASEYHVMFLQHLQKQLNEQQQQAQHNDKKELWYPLLDITFQQHLDFSNPALTLQLYQYFKNGFMRTIDKPHKAGAIYKYYPNCTLHLIECCMPVNECCDFSSKQLKFDAIETYQIRCLHKIYQKAFNNCEGMVMKSRIFVNFLILQMQMLLTDLKMQKLSLEKLELFAYLIYEWWQQINSNQLNNEEIQTKAKSGNKTSCNTSETIADNVTATELSKLINYEKLLKSTQWLQFAKLCLKTAMQPIIQDDENRQRKADGDTDDNVVNDDNFKGLLLKLLALYCQNLYSDYQADNGEGGKKKDGFIQQAQQLFEMIQTHSRYEDIVLQSYRSATKTSQIKTELLYLLLILAQKSPKVLHRSQIPVLLGAYSARLSYADRYILALLHLYEQYDCGLEAYKPFIWGESAVAFYALRSADETDKTKLAEQETSVAQVMSLIDRQVCEYTLENFPIWRKLYTLQQLPEMHFKNPFKKSQQFGSNHLEEQIELESTSSRAISLNEMRLCPKRYSIYEECYDPAFFIPLMIMCFAPESYAHPARPVQNGLLAITFIALASQDKQMRMAAGCVQCRYRCHFESSNFYEKPLWIQAYQNLQAGLNDLRSAWLQHKGNNSIPRVPYIPALFVAKTFNLSTDPSHLLYKQLTMYLQLKSSFNFQCIPEFNVLFYSTEVEHQKYRKFIVEIIRSGIKCSSDLFLLVTTNTFKVLMGFYGNSISTLELNLLILSIFSSCVKIPASAQIMIEHVGILSWLASIITSIEFYQFDVIEGLITIINNLWYSLKANQTTLHNFKQLEFDIHHLVLQLLQLLSPRIAVNKFACLMNILYKTAQEDQQFLALKPPQFEHLLNCAEKHFQQLILPIRCIYENGGFGANSTTAYCDQLYKSKVEQTHILALSSLRSYTLKWFEIQAKATTTTTELETKTN